MGVLWFFACSGPATVGKDSAVETDTDTDTDTDADTDADTDTDTDTDAVTGGTGATGDSGPDGCDGREGQVLADGAWGTDLQVALDTTSGLVEVCRGVYPGPFVVPRGVTVRAIDPAGDAILDGASTAPTVTALGAVTLEGLVLSGAGDTAVYARGSNVALVLRSCRITENHGYFGGGVYVEGGTLLVESSDVSHNTGVVGAGIYARRTVVTLTDTTVSDNVASQTGGGAFAVATIWSGGTFERNSAEKGGGLALDAATVSDAVVRGNTATRFGGGGVQVIESGALSASTVEDNVAQWGGGLSLDGVAGYALYSTFQVTDTVLRGNAAPLGGGIAAQGAAWTVTMDDVVVETNTADEGAGLYVTDMVLAITGGSVSGNLATVRGGGLWYEGSRQGLSASAVDFGAPPVDNGPDDVWLAGPDLSYVDYAAAATFVCDTTACVP